jgi:ABC-2 type transport system ATP-binding protein
MTPFASIHVQGLRKVYPGGVEAVKGLDFDVPAGEVFGLLGPNGAGKSTTIGMLTTTIVPTSGSARLGGVDVVADPLAARRISAVVFQDPVVDGLRTGRRNLETHARLWGVTPAVAARRITELADAFGLGALLDRPVETYSGGERRRLEIVRALLSQPQVLFLDEPTVGLDPRIRYELLDLIAGLRSRTDMTILLTTHYLDEAEQLCDRVAIVHAGRIVALDRPAALLARLGGEILEVRLQARAADGLALLRSHRVAGDDAFVIGSTITVPIHAGSARHAVAAVTDLGLAVAAVTTRPPTLDDVYLQLTGDRIAA